MEFQVDQSKTLKFTRLSLSLDLFEMICFFRMPFWNSSHKIDQTRLRSSLYGEFAPFVYWFHQYMDLGRSTGSPSDTTEHEDHANRPIVEALGRQQEKRASFNNQTPFTLSKVSTIDEQLDNLVEALQGELCTSATVQCELPPLVDWDSHSENHLNQSQAFDASFYQLKGLIDRLHGTSDLSGAPLIESTTVMVLSEMGRTPKLNITNGKDHWPYTSMMLVGAGVRGGQVWGETDSGLVGLPVDPSTGQVSPSGSRLQTAAIHAGFLESLGIDTSGVFPDTLPFTAPFEAS